MRKTRKEVLASAADYEELKIIASFDDRLTEIQRRFIVNSGNKEAMQSRYKDCLNKKIGNIIEKAILFGFTVDEVDYIRRNRNPDKIYEKKVLLYKRDEIKVATQLQYDEETINKIKEAKSIKEISAIMSHARTSKWYNDKCDRAALFRNNVKENKTRVVENKKIETESKRTRHLYTLFFDDPQDMYCFVVENHSKITNVKQGIHESSGLYRLSYKIKDGHAKEIRKIVADNFIYTYRRGFSEGESKPRVYRKENKNDIK